MTDEIKKLEAKQVTYDNVVIDAYGEVKNLQYPVSQLDLDSLCRKLPRFVNLMGELFLTTRNFRNTLIWQRVDEI